MAPEVFKADEDADEHLDVAFPGKADVYNSGIVYSEILTGKFSFQDVDIKLSELYKLLTDSENPLRPTLPESSPESLASLICACWHTDPRRRPAFTKTSKILRHHKGLLMLTDDGQLEPWMETKLQSLSLLQGKHELCIKQVTSTSPPYSLFYTTFDGSSSTTAIPLPNRMCSPNGMSLADHHGTLEGLHRAVRSKDYTGTVTHSRAHRGPVLR